jgi:hypothetical protein
MSNDKKTRDERTEEHAKEVAETFKKDANSHIVSNDHNPDDCEFCKENLRKSIRHRSNKKIKKKRALLPLKKVTIFDVKNEVEANKIKWIKNIVENCPRRKNDTKALLEITLCSYWLGRKFNQYNVSAPCQYDMCVELMHNALRHQDMYTAVTDIWNTWCEEEGARTGKTVFRANLEENIESLDVPYFDQISKEEMKKRIQYFPVQKDEKKVKMISTKYHVDLVKEYKN